MSKISYDPACAEIFDDLRRQADHYRPTLVCGLYCPEANQVALVQSTADAREMAIGIAACTMQGSEALLLSLKPIQGGIEPEDTTLADVFEREVRQEAGSDVLNAVVSVHGIRTEVPIIGGRPRSGKQLKTFGFVLGIVGGTPEMHPQDPNEVIRAGWIDADVAYGFFEGQANRRGTTEGRGERSLVVSNYIRELFPRPLDTSIGDEDLDDG